MITKDYLKRYVETFLMAHFLISIVIGICGLLIDWDQELHYWEFFIPTVFALLCALPILLTLHQERLSTKQLIQRRILQLLIAEVIVLALVASGEHGFRNTAQLIIVAASVPFVFLGLCFFDWLLGYLEAQSLNRCLREMQNKQVEKK